MTDEKPLFIPLKAEHFAAFESGDKIIEWRAYGPRWNERTCRVGRAAVLSLGYGKARRMRRTVFMFEKVPRDLGPKTARGLLPSAQFFAAIWLKVPT